MAKSSKNLRMRAFQELLSATILENQWIPHDPTPKQAEFLCLTHKEAFYGGAAGGGKSEALLMAALQYVHCQRYSAILFRKNYPELSLPGALMDRGHEWLRAKARWNEQTKTYHFPSGATLTFGYLQSETDKYRYQSAEFQFIGFDELTEFPEHNYRFLFSRLRKTKDNPVPLRMRAASNPGGVGHEWVKQRFIVEGGDSGRAYVPARLDDNPYLNRGEYEKSLAELDPVTRAQLLGGDWTARQAGDLFRREWFEIVDEAPADLRKMRYWDLAATEPTKGKDPDWTAGGLVGEKDGVYWVLYVHRTRSTPRDVEALIYQQAVLDGTGVQIQMEQEPGASGVNTIDHYRRRVLKGFALTPHKPTGPKAEYWRILSSAAQAGNVKLVRGPWIGWWLDEVEAAPNGAHDDGLDAVSRAVSILGRTEKHEGPWVF